LRVLILGSAAGGGFPQWNCGCINCQHARRGDGEAAARTQSAVAVTGDGRHWILLNASPDVRQQLDANPPLHPPPGQRGSPVRGVVLTNGDLDHIAGLLSLRERQPLSVYATERVLRQLRENRVFDVLDPEIAPRRELELEQPFELRGPDGESLGMEAVAFPVPGKNPLYAEDPAVGPGPGSRPGDTIGIEIRGEDSARRFCYIPGCAAVDEALRERLHGVSVLLFDGTLWHDDEMIAAGLGSRTGRRMGHMSMSGPEGSIAALAAPDVRRRVFVHINNSNPVLRTHSAERAAAAAAGWEIAHDGMEIVP